ncbi:unnamed protein product [Moneuplotes crassus]|uniref:Uncharacterized protein n=1 Tax=Euplotes crassus TaxID=5936 RepID=A0AAD1UTC8_EUPCR|nr:unnamed protein product [Moneuplotes crassus]
MKNHLYNISASDNKCFKISFRYTHSADKNLVGHILTDFVNNRSKFAKILSVSCINFRVNIFLNSPSENRTLATNFRRLIVVHLIIISRAAGCYL